MNPTVLAAITAVLSIIQTVVVPLITKEGADQAKINSVIDLLEKLLPIIGDQIATFATVIKNIISALSATPGTPAEQLARLQALDAKVDADFDAAAAAVDPDAGAPA